MIRPAQTSTSTSTLTVSLNMAVGPAYAGILSLLHARIQ